MTVKMTSQRLAYWVKGCGEENIARMMHSAGNGFIAFKPVIAFAKLCWNTTLKVIIQLIIQF